MDNAPKARQSRVPRIMLLGALMAIVGLVGWIWSQQTRNHWGEVARARYHLDRGKPDAAIEALAGIRDEAPGSAEGLTLAARAFLMRGNVAQARMTLER